MAIQTFEIVVPKNHKIVIPAEIPAGTKGSLKFKVPVSKKPVSSQRKKIRASLSHLLAKNKKNTFVFGALKHLGPCNLGPDESGIDDEAIKDMEAEWDEFYGPGNP